MYTFGSYEFPTFALPNLGQFQVTDPFFDANEFLSFAQGAYLAIHQAMATGQIDTVRNLLNEPMFGQLRNAGGDARWTTPVQAIVQSSILSVAHDNRVDTVTVRVAARSTAKKKNELLEDWTFTRPAANWGGLDAPPVTQCPSCGAPASTDERGACRYCKVPIKGVAGDWRLISAQVVDTKQQKATTGRGCWSGFWIFIILTTVVLPLGITGVILWFVRDTTTNALNFGNGFFPTTTVANRTPSTPTVIPTSGAMRGTVTMSAGLNGSFPVKEVSFIGSPQTGACQARAAAATGVTMHSVGDNDDGVRQDLTITVAVPEGKKGPSTYPDAVATVVLVETPSPGRAPTVALENNTWTGPATLTVADNTGNVTMSGLTPTDPKWSTFAGTVTFTCTG